MLNSPAAPAGLALEQVFFSLPRLGNEYERAPYSTTDL